MSSLGSICLIDTSIFLNLLDVPNRNQERASVLKTHQDYVARSFTFLLPIATIIETGNHIAQNGDGRIRRSTAQLFVKEVTAAFKGDSPWLPTSFINQEETEWLQGFPDLAGQNKALRKQEGTSFGDFTIIEEFQQVCLRSPMSEVFIWSLDSDLKGYHQIP
jgi:hypothetical protein